MAGVTDVRIRTFRKGDLLEVYEVIRPPSATVDQQSKRTKAKGPTPEGRY
jgi:hypothetical protein